MTTLRGMEERYADIGAVSFGKGEKRLVVIPWGPRIGVWGLYNKRIYCFNTPVVWAHFEDAIDEARRVLRLLDNDETRVVAIKLIREGKNPLEHNGGT